MDKPKPGEWWLVRHAEESPEVPAMVVADDGWGLSWDVGDCPTLLAIDDVTPIRRIPTAEQLAEMERERVKARDRAMQEFCKRRDAERERDDAVEDRAALRDSLANELRGVLASRGVAWQPSRPSDLIPAFAGALDDLRRERDEARAQAELCRLESAVGLTPSNVVFPWEKP